MRKVLPLLILSMGMSSTVLAKSAVHPCHSVSSDIHRDIELTKVQRGLLREMYSTQKELRQAKKKRSQFDQRWMEQFVAGYIERQQVERTLAVVYGEKEDKDFELYYINFDLLEGYSQQQRNQVTYNIEDNRQCYKDHAVRAQAKKAKAAIRPMAVLLQDLELTERQDVILTEIKQVKYQHREELSMLSPKTAYEQFVQGQIDKESMLGVLEAHSDLVFNYRSQAVGMWMDLLETLTAEQRTQFLDNAAELEEQRLNIQRKNVRKR